MSGIHMALKVYKVLDYCQHYLLDSWMSCNFEKRETKIRREITDSEWRMMISVQSMRHRISENVTNFKISLSILLRFIMTTLWKALSASRNIIMTIQVFWIIKIGDMQIEVSVYIFYIQLLFTLFGVSAHTWFLAE